MLKYSESVSANVLVLQRELNSKVSAVRDLRALWITQSRVHNDTCYLWWPYFIGFLFFPKSCWFLHGTAHFRLQVEEEEDGSTLENWGEGVRAGKWWGRGHEKRLDSSEGGEGKVKKVWGEPWWSGWVRRSIWVPKWCWRWYTGQDELQICAILCFCMQGEGRKGGTKQTGDLWRERHGKGLRVTKCTEWAASLIVGSHCFPIQSQLVSGGCEHHLAIACLLHLTNAARPRLQRSLPASALAALATAAK